MANLALEAMLFARSVHANQVRKYTGNPYADHLAEVAGIVATVLPEMAGGRSDLEFIIATAWLHDCVEDQDVTPAELFRRFGTAVADGVMRLSDLEIGNRAERKAASRVRLAAAPGWVQTIKCADLISNTSSIVLHDPKFAETYLREKRELLAVMGNADRRLWEIAMRQADKAPAQEPGEQKGGE
jgi:GTP diphosphokinase / guanosine-3',5'-bis(diphosphate) 3'-diphosphatase